MRGMSHPSFCWCEGSFHHRGFVLGVCVCTRRRRKKKKSGGGVSQSRVINHQLGSKKKYEGFRTNYICLHCAPSALSSYTLRQTHTHTHTHTPTHTHIHVYGSIVQDQQNHKANHQALTSDYDKKVESRNEMLKCTRLRGRKIWKFARSQQNFKTQTRAHTDTGQLVQQGHISLTFPVLVNFCIFVVLVTSAPQTNTLCLAKYQRGIFLLYVLHLCVTHM